MGIIQRIFGVEERAAPKLYGGVQESTYTLSQVKSWFQSVFNTSGQTVNAETSMKLSAYYACIRNISEDLAKVPFETFSVDEQGNKTYVKHRATSLLNKMPSNLYTPFTFKQTMQEYALRFGNAYAYLRRDPDGKVTQMVIVDPTNVTVQIVDQKLYYIINDVKSGVEGIFSEDNIFHIRAMGDGYVGKSILQYAAESLGSALAIQSYASSFFGSGATMTGVLEVPGVVKDENTANSIKNSFNDSYKNINGTNNGVALLHSGAKFSKISAQPNEAQMVEAKEFSVADVAKWFRMPLSKLQAGATGSSNLEQLNIEYVTDCLMPWFVRWEQEIERKLFRFDEMDSLDAKFNVAMLMRGDMQSTAEYLKTLKYAGFITSNDGRRFVGLNTINETFADQIYSPVNMIPAAKEDDFWANKDQSQTSTKGTDQ
jgi:HK97 family phage portal protein